MARNVLVCDDAAFMRMMIKDILTKNGYNIAGEAENGVKAIEKYNELKPDLVLMDITMPEMDGIQALKKIKEAHSNSNIPLSNTKYLYILRTGYSVCFYNFDICSHSLAFLISCNPFRNKIGQKQNQQKQEDYCAELCKCIR